MDAIKELVEQMITEMGKDAAKAALVAMAEEDFSEDMPNLAVECTIKACAPTRTSAA